MVLTVTPNRPSPTAGSAHPPPQQGLAGSDDVQGLQLRSAARAAQVRSGQIRALEKGARRGPGGAGARHRGFRGVEIRVPSPEPRRPDAQTPGDAERGEEGSFPAGSGGADLPLVGTDV